MRRYGGMIALFLVVSALVVGGLTWLTYGTLREEAERRRSEQLAQRAEKVRLALWKLDGRIYLPLGLEGYRKFEDYTALWTPPAGDRSQYLSPLVSVELPLWMGLHVQFDPKVGWQSPQVMTDSQYARLSDPKLDLDLTNVSDDRAQRFVRLQNRFPLANTLAQLQRLAGESQDAAVIVQGNPFDPANIRGNHNNDLSVDQVGRANSVPYQGASPMVSPPQLSRLDDNSNLGFNKVVRDAKGAGQGLPQKVDPSQTPEGSTPQMASPGNRNATPQRGGSGMGQFPNSGGRTGNEANPLLKKTANAPTMSVLLGAMRPVWLFDSFGEPSLFVVRFARIDQAVVYQGIQLDWATLEAELKAEVAEEFPDAELRPALEPLTTIQLQMSALPVAFDPGPLPMLPKAGWTPLRMGLTLAWLAALLAIGAAWFVGSSLVDLSERRMRFVSAVTHELRTPLTSLRLYLDMLTSGLVTEEAKKREYLTTLSHESDRLHQLIENVLDFAKLEKQAATVTAEQVLLSILIVQIQETWADRLAADGKQLVIDSKVPDGLLLRTDSRVLLQVLGNLIDNARKYSQGAADPRVWLRVKREGAKIVFEVEDRGPGLAAGESRSIFRAFQRGHASGATGGAGLGLALASQWVAMLSGSIDCQPTEQGVGIVFRVCLPE